MKRTMTTSGLVVAALALGAFAMSTLPAEAGRARSGARIGPFLINGAHASVGYHSQPQPTPSPRPNPSPSPSPSPRPNPSIAKPESIAKPDADTSAEPGPEPDTNSRTQPGAANTVGFTVWQEEPVILAGSLFLCGKPHSAKLSAVPW